MSKTLALSEPTLNGKEWRYVKECLDTAWLSTAGKFVDRFEEDICRLTGARYAVAVTSGTVALKIGLEVAGVQPDEEVLVPTVTFIAPVNAVRYLGAHPVFMDADDHYNMDIHKTIEFLRKETKRQNGHCLNKTTQRKIRAIIPVHIFGHAVDLEPLIKACKESNIRIIEDATESLGTKYKEGRLKGRYTGTIGEIGCYSFNGNKIITAGGGGMMVTDQKPYASEAKYLTTQAKDDPLYYIHNTIGYNERLNNLQAAIGVAQLKGLSEIIRIKKENYQIYQKHMNTIEGLHLAEPPAYADNNNWMYALQVNAKRYGRSRDELIRLFIEERIEVRPLWHLNHLQKPYQQCQTFKIENAYRLLQSTLNLPCSAHLTEQDILKVVRLLKKWKK